MSENQAPVEENVHDSHDNRRESNHLRIGDSDIERTEQIVENHEDNTKLTVFQIVQRRSINVFRTDDDAHQAFAAKEQNAEKQNAKQKHEHGAMLKHLADFLEIAFAKTTRDKYLNANGKAHGQSGKHIILKARHHGGTHLDGAQMTQKSGIGKSDDGLGQIAQHDGIGNAPNLTVWNGSI